MLTIWIEWKTEHFAGALPILYEIAIWKAIVIDRNKDYYRRFVMNVLLIYC